MRLRKCWARAKNCAAWITRQFEIKDWDARTARVRRGATQEPGIHGCRVVNGAVKCAATNSKTFSTMLRVPGRSLIHGCGEKSRVRSGRPRYYRARICSAELRQKQERKTGRSCQPG